MLRSAAIQPPARKTRGMKRTLALLVGLSLLAAHPAAAQGRFGLNLGLGLGLGVQQGGEPRGGSVPTAARLVPLGTVIEHLRRITPGRPLDAGSEYMGDRPVYRV